MTLDQVNALTVPERNRKIAEICGFKINPAKDIFKCPCWEKDGIEYMSHHDCAGSYVSGVNFLPDYGGSLDACAQMVTVMSYEQAEAFEDKLYDIVEHDWQSLDTCPPLRFAVCNATSEQRSKAFLMVMLP